MNVEFKIMIENQQLSLLFVNGVIFSFPFIVTIKHDLSTKKLISFVNKLIQELTNLILEIKQENKDFLPHQIIGILTERYHDGILTFLKQDIEEILEKNYTIKQFIKLRDYGKL